MEKERPSQELIVCLDDEAIYFEQLRSALEGHNTKFFLNPDFFFDSLERGDFSLDDVKAVITDYYFERASVEQMQFKNALKRRGFKGIYALHSSVPFKQLDKTEYDVMFRKSDWKSIKKYFSQWLRKT